jgi:hypothetical protein
VEALRSLLDHPCAHHQVVEHEVLDETFVVLRELGRFDEAIDARRAAIAAGYRSTPDPEADIAECSIESGNRAEADALFAVLRDRTPDDPWLYNSAGFADRGVDDRESLRWLLDGIDVAITTGDRDQVVTQLLEMAVEQWEGLGERQASSPEQVPGIAVAQLRDEVVQAGIIMVGHRVLSFSEICHQLLGAFRDQSRQVIPVGKLPHGVDRQTDTRRTRRTEERAQVGEPGAGDLGTSIVLEHSVEPLGDVVSRERLVQPEYVARILGQ